MSKTKDKVIDEQNEQQPASEATVESGSPAFVTELLEKGTTILTAPTREALAEMVNDIPADCSYGAGAVGFNPETGMYSLRIDLTSK